MTFPKSLWSERISSPILDDLLQEYLEKELDVSFRGVHALGASTIAHRFIIDGEASSLLLRVRMRDDETFVIELVAFGQPDVSQQEILRLQDEVKGVLDRAPSEVPAAETGVHRGRTRRPHFAAALDQGTTSSRAMIFDHSGHVVSVAQKEHEQIYPKPGWVEHDPKEIWARSQEVLDEALEKANASVDDIAGLGITNQRETTLVWDRKTGEPVHNALVWQDTRTDKLVDELSADGGQDRFRDTVGLPLATYFSGPKLRWILDNVDGAREKAEAGDLIFGNMDTWLIWNLTGGTDGGLHITDVTNASRTMLMDLRTLSWDSEIASAIGVPMSMLPEIRASSEVYGEVKSGSFAGVRIAGDLGDQQAATFGQACFSPGEAKNTYGTGNFMLINTGTELVHSKSGLLTTVGYKIGDDDAVYCLEGSIAITGALVQWLRDNLKLIKAAPEVEELARSVDDNGGLYIVPAFSGLFAPYWKSNARGVFAGLTRYVTAGHIARATLEATAFQTREVMDAMSLDSGVDLTELKVDGGMVHNDLLMQFQADLLGVPVIRPEVAETTALGAAYAAGLATGFWDSQEEVRSNWAEDKRWEPKMDAVDRDEYYRYWKKAVTRTFDWFD
jgi:glycerol kinase